MPDPVQLRDGTQIVLPRETLESLDVDVEDRFTVTVAPVDDDRCRVVGSPVVIKNLSDFLARNGVSMR
jgi:bifunctional DNA-binding transcriptional regulator/antitoxin component of YhaV-PrlF toxin-antitoxin module